MKAFGRGVGVVVSILLAMGGCTADKPAEQGDRPAGVVLRAHRDRYRAGDTVKITLENHSDAGVGYNLCFAFLELETLDGTAWRKVSAGLGPPLGPDDVLTACTAELRLMPPGQRANSVAHLPANLPAADYRIAYDAEIGRMRRRLTTQTFTVS